MDPSRGGVEVPGEEAGNSQAPGDSPASLGLDALRSARGYEAVTLDAAAFAAMFPRLAAVASLRDVAVLLASTRIVGMRAPGRWALFRRLSWVGFPAPDDPLQREAGLDWSMVAIDDRLSLVTLDIRDTIRRLRAEVIVRQPPPVQPDLRALGLVVDAGEFAGMRALIVGGSRGLGELAAKLVVAGGGSVLLTYRTGAADAHALAVELGGSAQAMAFDVARPVADGTREITASLPTHILYFATPPITRRPTGSWDPATYERIPEACM